MRNQLAGTGALLRLALRRDRVMMPVWILVVAMLVLSLPASLESVYGTAAERARLVATMTTNGSLRALYGPVFGDSIGALTAWRGGVFAGLLAGIMSLVIVVRHTREEEESGRQELLSAAMVGRRAPLTAALLAALTANALVALLVTAALAGRGAGGALALGLGIGATGMLFASLAAIAAQLTESARLAKGLAGAFVGAAFVLRAAGDAGTADGGSALTWASPLGWLEHVRAFAAERWWVLALFAAASAAQLAAAYALAARRDVGMSFLPARPGPAQGRLGTAGALAWRLQRGGLLGWSLGFLAAGLVFGGMTDGATELVGGNDKTREIIERMGGQGGQSAAQGALADTFLAAMAGMLGMVAALYIVSSVLRLSGEESGQRAEPLLAGAVGRLRWAGGHLAVAFGGSALILLLAGLGLGIGHGQDVAGAVGATLGQLPAVWVIGALAALLHGAAPRFAGAAWAVAGTALALGWVGPALNLPQAVLNLSPFAHLPKLPGAQALEWAPLVALTALAAALLAAGLTALRRRDLAA
ncbi:MULTISPECIES: ABC transporter permease [unclassified Streptomyces]|uniref:ABC transporter permease n=1 Tax=unclassified Streptomyces TaxID=2593676 RepID=UPI0022568D2C|nr:MULTISPECIES: ABC transporter permease [unclassified Streptomyces]MCX4527118.1 ABC transporter permease [Streptomyces sp. NBC_01551]MCX4542306.1 ABC transporter permease [Streptomyces sp. NBC_01565]